MSLSRCLVLVALAGCKGSPHRHEPPAPLAADRRIALEIFVGPQYYPDDLLVRAVEIRDERRLLALGVAIPPHGGAEVSNPALQRRVQRELARHLGGWFDADLARCTTLHEGLWTAEQRALYQGMGVRGKAVELSEVVYRLAFAKPPWGVEAIGVPGRFHAVVLFHLLSEEQAIGPGGHPRPWPAGPVEPLLQAAAPKLDLAALKDGAGTPVAAGYPFYRSDDRRVVRARVGRRLDPGTGRPLPDPDSHFFGVRVNLRLD